MTENSQQPESKLWDMIEEMRTGMLTVKRVDRLESRPMTAYVDRNQRLIWFITELDTKKTDEIEQDEVVNIAFIDNDDRSFVSVSGNARVVRDVAKQKQLWNAFAEAWLPEGPEAPNVGLIRVEPTDATYWDSPSSTAAQLWRIAVANATQTPPKGDDIRKVNLR